MNGALHPSLIEVAAFPDDAAAWAASVTPGSAVTGVLAALDQQRLSTGGQVDALVALEKNLAWLQAAQLRVLAQMAARAYPDGPRGECDKQWVREDVAAALRLSPSTAADRLELARELNRLPATLRSLEQGEITVHHARVLAEAVTALDDATATAVEAAVLPGAVEQSRATFRRKVTRAVLAAAPIPAEERHSIAVTERRVAIRPVADGMAELWALLPAEGAAAIRHALDRAADRREATDARSADQRRADALVSLITGESGGQLPLRRRRRRRRGPAIHVTVSLSTLLALDEQPGELAGHGPIPAELARHLAADPTGTWARLLTDERGALLDYGRTRYRPPADLDQFVRARDQTCRFPHCNRPATRTDLDHIQAWAEGGPTSERNLHALCERHHNLKHETRWQVVRHDNGTTEWISPTGRRHTVPAAVLPLDRTIELIDPAPTRADRRP